MLKDGKGKIEQFEELVSCFEKLPGIGKKSALRFAYHITLQDTFLGLNLAHSIENAISKIKKCQRCGNMATSNLCSICTDRESQILCIVENSKDILLIEQAGEYDGLYFVFNDVNLIEDLKEMIKTNSINEIIFAFTPSISSDGMILYIEDRLMEFDIKFTKIAQGIPTGVSLENVDTLSLSKAISGRIKI